MRNPVTTFPGRSLRLSGRALCAALLCAAAMLAALPVSARADVGFEAKGRWVCNNRGTTVSVAGARVELWKSNSYWFDDKLGSTHTSANGSFSFSVSAGSNFDLYAKLVLDDDQGVQLGEWYSFSPWDTETSTVTSHAGIVNLGTWEVSKDKGAGTPKCAIWQGAHNAYQDYKKVVGSAPPDSSYSISADFPCCGTPFTTTDTTRWPSDYQTGSGSADPDGGFSTNFHEFAHSVRHSFDGGTAHFLYDVARFSYPQNHSLCKLTNEGFAFNEGWAEYWAHTTSTCAGDPTNFNYEGNVATALTGLEKCANRPTMVRVLKENPGAIHSYAEFRSRFFAVVGQRACLISSITGIENVEGSLSVAQLTTSVEQQIGAQTQLIAKLSHQLNGVRSRAQSPGTCTRRQCLAGLQKVIGPAALNAQIAQAKLVRERLQAGLAAARSAGFDPDFSQAKLYETLEAERKAFERANQTILIAGLKQSINTVKSKRSFSPARSTNGFRVIGQRLSSLTKVRTQGAVIPPGLQTLYSAPSPPTDVARHVAAR